LLPIAIEAGCDAHSDSTATQPPAIEASPAAASAFLSAEAKAPEIIIGRMNVDVGKDRVPTSDPALADRTAVFLRGAPAIEGRIVDVVVLRAAKPSHVAAVLDALRQEKATGANMKTDSRDGATETLPVAFVPTLPDCATVAWIAKDAAIDVWRAGGGVAKRVLRGLAGPDLTLGLEAVEKQGSNCAASQFALGADDAMTWGLVFDLGRAALHAPWTRTSSAVLVTAAIPGRRLSIR
jgi:hypothetical protein